MYPTSSHKRRNDQEQKVNLQEERPAIHDELTSLSPSFTFTSHFTSIIALFLISVIEKPE